MVRDSENDYDPGRPNDYEEVRKAREVQRKEAELEVGRQELLKLEARRQEVWRSCKCKHATVPSELLKFAIRICLITRLFGHRKLSWTQDMIIACQRVLRPSQTSTSAEKKPFCKGLGELNENVLNLVVA